MITTFIVDDEPLARSTLRQMIEAVPWVRHLGEAADGLSAVESVNTLVPDVVFLDIQMPGISGLEVVQRLTGTPGGSCQRSRSTRERRGPSVLCGAIVLNCGRRRVLRRKGRLRDPDGCSRAGEGAVQLESMIRPIFPSRKPNSEQPSS